MEDISRSSADPIIHGKVLLPATIQVARDMLAAILMVTLLLATELDMWPLRIRQVQAVAPQIGIIDMNQIAEMELLTGKETVQEEFVKKDGCQFWRIPQLWQLLENTAQ